MVMHRERRLKFLAKLVVKALRLLFRLPRRMVALIIYGAYKIATRFDLPPEAVSDLCDAWQAMRNGPPLSESLQGFMLKSDPVILEDFIFNTLRGDPPLEDIKPW